MPFRVFFLFPVGAQKSQGFVADTAYPITTIRGFKEYLDLSRSPHRCGRVPNSSRTKFRGNNRLVRLTVSLMVLLATCAVLAASFVQRGSAQVDVPTQDTSSFNSRDKAKRFRPESVPGEIIVRFRDNVKASKAGTQLELAVIGGPAQIPIPAEIPITVEQLAGPELLRGLRLARVAPGETDRAIAALRARPDVLYAEPNYIRYAQKTPNDPRYPELWGLNNTGQSSTSGGNPGTPGNDIRAEQAWDLTTGSKDVVVGVIDEGIDINHEDLSENIWKNPGEIPNNGTDDDSNGFIDDINGWDFAHNDNSVFDYSEAISTFIEL